MKNEMNFPHRVEIQSQASAYTGVVTLTKIRDQWCKITPLGVKTEAQLSAMGAKITHKIDFRNKPAVNIGLRAAHAEQIYAITGVDQGNKKFTIAGDSSAEFFADKKITVDGSTGNDGTYTIVGAVKSGANTVVEVLGAISSAVADGNIELRRNYEIASVRIFPQMQEARAYEVQ